MSLLPRYLILTKAWTLVAETNVSPRARLHEFYRWINDTLRFRPVYETVLGTALIAGKSDLADYAKSLLKYDPCANSDERAKKIRRLTFDFYMLSFIDLSRNREFEALFPKPCGLLTIDKHLLPIRYICESTGIETAGRPQFAVPFKAMIQDALYDDVEKLSASLSADILQRAMVLGDMDIMPELMARWRSLADADSHCPF